MLVSHANRCVSNCGTYINTAERLVLHASCTNCGDEDEVSFTWELGVTTGHQSGISLASDWSAQTTTGLDQAYMGIKPSAYASVTEAGSALFRVTGELQYRFLYVLMPYACRVVL